VTRFEFESSAAIFVHDFESSWMAPLDDPDAQHVALGSLFRGATWSMDELVSAHINAPHLPWVGDPEDVERTERWNREREELRAAEPAPVVYRVKVSIEYERLSDEESAKAITEALARDVARRDAQMKDGAE
jgi:hypothetical protein